VSESTDYAYTFEISSDVGLSDSLTYNASVNGRFTAGTKNPDKNTLDHFSGTDPTIWRLTESPYGKIDGNFYISIDDPSLTYTVTYNEIADAWVSRNSFVPRKYIQLDTNFLSSNDYKDLYKHNDSDAERCTYYGTEYDSEFTIIFNKDFQFTKVWDGLKWYSESKDSDGIDQFKDTFDTVTISNDYQHTGPRNIYYAERGATVPATYPMGTVRRDRTFCSAIPRSVINADVSDNEDITLSANWDESQTFKERIRDKYIKVNTTYDNSTGNTFSIPFISASYRQSVR